MNKTQKKIIGLTITPLLIAFCFICMNIFKKKQLSLIPTVEEEEVLVYTNAAFYPYEYYDNGNVKGIDIEIAKEICSSLGKEMVIKDIPFDDIINCVASVDKQCFAISALTVTEERKKNLLFSDVYMENNVHILTLKTSNIHSRTDLIDKKIGVQLGNTAEIYCTEDFGMDAVFCFPTIVDAVNAVKIKKVDACCADLFVLQQIVNELDPQHVLFDISEESYSNERYAIAVNKKNPELLRLINVRLKQMKESHRLDEIIGNYIK